MSDVDTRPDGAEIATESTETVNIPDSGTTTVETRPDGAAGQSDTFPREYVESLRKESAGYRDRAKAAEERADALAKRLHAELVRANGTLVDPDALMFDPEHLDDAEKLSAAIEALTEAKPYLKVRRPTGDAGQGPRGGTKAAPTWADLF